MVSLLAAGLICQYTGDAWEEKLRTGLYQLSNDSIVIYSETVTDQQGIPFVKYKEAKGIQPGEVYNPTIVSNYAIDYFKKIETGTDGSANVKFYNCIAWLSQNMTLKDSFAIFEFKWRQTFYDSVGAPWTSGMTSGRAMEAFTLAYQLDKNQEHLKNAQSLLRGFYQPIQSGGFTYKEKNGWWFEEFADSNLHTPRVLDGHIFAMMGVYHFLQLGRNDSAEYVFSRGLSALTNNLANYDKGDGWSYYDAQKTVSDKKYHTLLTGQMKELWELTTNPIFETYYKKWEKPLNRPYVYRIIKEKNRSGILLLISLSAGIFLAFTVLRKVFTK